MTLTPRQLHKFLPEYISIIRRAGTEGWLNTLVRAHARPCGQDQAIELLRGLPLPRIRLRWAGRGRARFNPQTRWYGMSLPREAGGTFGRLRVGVVLHEAAHILDRREVGTFSHGPTFCKAFKNLLEDWKPMPTDMEDIYLRHTGPYSLLLTRKVAGKKQQAEIKGPYLASAAHQEAIRLISQASDEFNDRPIIEVYVYSDKEKQFIGAMYFRGQEYAPFTKDGQRERRVELPSERQEAALLPGGQESLPQVDAPQHERLSDDSVSDGEGVRDLPEKPARRTPAKTAGSRFPSVRGKALEIDPGQAERWPASKPAQLLRAWFEEGGRKATAAEAVQALGTQLKEMGMEHPASLVSRLKQAGFIRSVQE